MLYTVHIVIVYAIIWQLYYLQCSLNQAASALGFQPRHMAFHVSLLSGKSVTISNIGKPTLETVKQLRVAAESLLGIGIEQLIFEGVENVFAAPKRCF